MSKQKSPKKHKAALLIVILAVAAVAVFLVMRGPLSEMQYPLAYTESIQRNADRFGLDPYRVAAVIKTESDFKADARSRAGAIGLMQIMPETGAWIAEKLGVENFTPDMLADPERNIEFGCWYMQFLDERFDGDPELMSAAYNAGHNRVKQWLEDSAVSADGEHLHDIPYPETKDYVVRIEKAYETYRRLYPNVFR
ncbi:MAG: lytic transglycosylase domain-containing protein [Clostridia bacterium]|nr:lytic transglycosylase domain-containing protein [Clostridia bacterium]